MQIGSDEIDAVGCHNKSLARLVIHPARCTLSLNLVEVTQELRYKSKEPAASIRNKLPTCEGAESKGNIGNWVSDRRGDWNLGERVGGRE